jgi:cytochrome c oxidase assembly protein subunit 15
MGAARHKRQTARMRQKLHWLAAATAAATIVLMGLGSLVHSTGSSLACPDWPLCNGEVLPKMVGGVAFEHTHRIVGAMVATTTAVLLFFALRWRAPGRAWVVAAAGLVVVQATLGGLTVLFKLPPAISIAHLATSMTFVSVLVVSAVRLAPEPIAPGTLRGAAPWIGLAIAIVFAQIVLGAVVRHRGVALGAHRAGGALAWTATIAASASLWLRVESRWRLLAAAPAALASIQVALGVATALAYAPLDLATAHHVTGALLLASLVLALALSLRTERAREDRGRVPVRPRERAHSQGVASLRARRQLVRGDARADGCAKAARAR